jgi:hypothetical protein
MFKKHINPFSLWLNSKELNNKFVSVECNYFWANLVRRTVGDVDPEESSPTAKDFSMVF